MKPAVKTIASLAFIAGGAQALAVPPWLTSSSSSSSSNNAPAGKQGVSSMRKTVNFGPSSHQVKLESMIDPSADLVRFNNKAAQIASRHSADSRDSLSSDPATAVGQAISDEFLRDLYPHATFRLTSSHVSKHSNVFHAYYTQVADSLDIVNSFVNVNVNLNTMQILSYGDSSYAKHNGHASAWKDRLSDWASARASDASQLVFGARASRPTHVKGHNIDPRHGLISLLSLVTDAPEVKALLAFDREDVFSTMSITSLADDSFTIAGVPSAIKDVNAKLAYIEIEGRLRPVWQYELQLNDNAYEACVSADAEVVGAEEPLSVIDWVRDFRPTGGEVVLVGDDLVSLSSDGAEPRKSPRNPVLSMRDALHRQRLIVETEKEQHALSGKGRASTSPSYKVFPWGTNDPVEGKRQMLKGTLVEMSTDASPSGWHTVPAESKGGKDTFYSTTRGNNVIAQDNPDGMNSFEHNYRPSGGADMSFAFPLHWPKAGIALEPSTYINASVTELFYTNNELHDFFWAYGFDEASGNFQEANFGRGGSGGDAVQANAQDGSGFNNANFMTPPDGQRPRMRMYVWNQQQPFRDGDLEAGIVTHEYSHGVSTRLTGGRMNSGCLGWGEAGGAGEGWGDFFATMIRMHNLSTTDYSMGEWASGRIGGIRNYRYTTNQTMNPDTYKSLDKPGYWGVHAIGEVWAEMLFEVAELLIEQHGFKTGSLFPPASGVTDSDFYDDKYKQTKVPKHGNTLAVQLVIDAMKIQPCRPSFVNMRDAILQADHALTGGDNFCTIYKGFAKRGLGVDAELVGGTPWGGGRHSESYATPKRCEKSGKKPKKMTA